MKLTKVWIVKDPTPDSDPSEILFEIPVVGNQIDHLVNYIIGSPRGAWWQENTAMYSDHASAKADANKRLARVGKGGTSGWQIFQGATASGRKTAWFAGNPHTDNADGPFGSKRQAEEYAKHYDARGGGKKRHAPSALGALTADINRLVK